MEQLYIFDDKFQSMIKEGVELLQIESSEVKEIENQREEWALHNLTNLSCSYCKTEFGDVIQHREHYKLDWHRYNLRQNLVGRLPITEEEFNAKSDISSISGSDSEKEDILDNIATSEGKVFLKTQSGRIFGIYRNLLFEKKEELNNNIMLSRLKLLTVNSQWTLLMLGGGHFAGAVFKGKEPFLHKTFHCYTVRAGQGGSQGTRDNRGSQPKSAGASLRRYNESALVQHVKDIIEVWKSEIQASNLIIFRAPGPYNRAVLFGGKNPPLNRIDPRLKMIPFSTRRATFTELKRVHSLLVNISIYESTEKIVAQKPESPVKRKLPQINRCKSREDVQRPLPTEPILSCSDSEGSCKELETGQCEISFKETLQVFEDTLTIEQKRRQSKKKPKTQKPKKDTFQTKKLYEEIVSGDINNLENVNLNVVLDDRGNTMLHVACMHKHTTLVKYLLNAGADPCKRNEKQQTPYTSTEDKDIRQIFKDFAIEFPEKYNYNKAQIPLSVLTSEEQAEKKKLQRKAKREKEKEKKKLNIIKKQENLEKERFLNLSDREKRTLAAERRILNQSGAIIARCFLCASDISGKVPFEYSGNRFCSVNCLKAHRLSKPAVLSC